MDASKKPEPSPLLLAAQARETFIARTMVALAQLHRTRGAPVGIRALADELRSPKRLIRESLRALESCGLLVEARRGGWLASREPSQITMAQVREAARSSLGFPRWEADAAGEALLQAWQRAEGAAAGALGEPLSDFLQRVEPAGQRPAPSALSAVPGPQEDEGRQPAATARKPVSV